jgi:hypothetical protein
MNYLGFKSGQKIEIPSRPQTSKTIYNVANSKYLHTDLSLGTTSNSWNLLINSFYITFCNARDTTPVYFYLSAEERYGNPFTKTYAGTAEIWSQNWDSATSSYYFINLRNNTYLACGSDGIVVQTTSLDSTCKWLATNVSGLTYVFKNYAYSTLYLRASLDGFTVNAKASSSPTTDPLCLWYISDTPYVVLEVPSTAQFLQSYNTTYQLTTSATAPGIVFSLLLVNGTNQYVIQSTWGGYLNVNGDGATLSEYPYTDPGKVPTSGQWIIS